MSYRLRCYYFKVVIPSVQLGLYDTGNDLTKEETHDFLKDRFLQVEFLDEQTWTYRTEMGSTKELPTKEFRKFIDRIQQWAAEYLNIYIRDPNENELNEPDLNPIRINWIKKLPVYAPSKTSKHMSNLTNKWSQQPEQLRKPDFTDQMQVIVMEHPKTLIYVPKNATKKEIKERKKNYLKRFQESQTNYINRNGGR